MKNMLLTKFPALLYLAAEHGNGRLAHSADEVISAKADGIAPERIFYIAPFNADAESVLQDCRFLARNLEDLCRLEQIAAKTGNNEIVKVGLRLQASGFGKCGEAVELIDLAHIAHEVKRMPHLTVRGCFFCGDLREIHGKSLGRFFRAGYEAAKRMTVTLPCAMPYICFEGVLNAFEENAVNHPETLDALYNALDILIMQNQTAFYADLWVM